MESISVVLLSSLLCSALSAPLKINEETVTMFLGEDFYVPLASLKADVSFRPRVPPRSAESVLMKAGVVVSSRVKLNAQLSHLVVEGVAKGDEGVYAVKSGEEPDLQRHYTLVVRDCSIEQSVKYGDNFHIQLLGVRPPITLEYKPSAVDAEQTSSSSRSAMVLLTSTGLARDGYQGRVSANPQHVELRAATGADQGSYTVRDAEGSVQRKVCLIVKEHQNFDSLPYGSTLKIHLILNSSVVQVFYTPDNDPTARLLLDKGELTPAQVDLGLEDRLSLEGSMLALKQVKGSDAGQFKVTDELGFAVSNVYLEVQSYRLPTLYVAIIALVGLLVFLLLVCLLSCLIKVKKRAKRAAALEKIAEESGKEDDGKAFVQVVKEITHINEESKHSQADNTEKSQSTEVDIKGLEVSSKEVLEGANLETSDSGVEFNTTGLPLDTDTEVPESEAVSVSISASVKATPPAQAETKPSAPPAEVKPIPAPEVKPSPPPAEVKPIQAPEVKPSPPPAEVKPIPVPEVKPSPSPETKKTPDQPAEPKLSLPKPETTRPSSVPSPEPKAALVPSPEPKAAPVPSPEPKAAPVPSPEPKAASLLSPSPKTTAPTTPEPKAVLTPTPTNETPKAVTPEPAPTANGTPEPESKPGPDPGGPTALKATPPKTPEVEGKSSGTAAGETKGAEDTSTTA